MQIKGEEFIRKVQLQQEREELERKLSELEEVQISIGNNNYTNNNETISFDRNPQMESNEHELDNIMLGSTSGNGDDNKKKYLILGIVLVVLFLLTIIIIRLLTNDPNKEDQFTSNNANSSEVKKLSENSNIEENFQKIINERVKKDSTEQTVSDNSTTDQRLESLRQTAEANQAAAETAQEDSSSITNETLDETMKKIEEKKSGVKQKTTETVEKKAITTTKEVVEKKAPVKEVKEVVEKKYEPKFERTEKKEVRETVETTSSSDVAKTGAYYVQIGAFSKKPSDSYVNNIRNAKFKYKIYQEDIKGTTFNKVLIGPYSSKAAASESVEDIKQKLEVSSAFVVKF